MKDMPMSADRLAPRQQRSWDWRAAANFICGGAGGGLLFWAALISLRGDDMRAFLVTGLALVAFGLTCVWFEIGRPWRALNVFRHVASSWMTREASVAPLLFVCGGLALWSGQAVLVWATGLLGGAFLYSQARILAADKGIPAWRHPRCTPLMVATGLTEGVGLVALAAAIMPEFLLPAAPLLALLAALRVFAWRRYLAGLEQDGAPAGAVAALRRLDGRFVWSGNALPALLAIVAVAAGLPSLAALAGAAAVVAGMEFKYALVCRAAFSQGFALPKQPVRGGVTAPGVRPDGKGADKGVVGRVSVVS